VSAATATAAAATAAVLAAQRLEVATRELER
jgi:hypothetical protein